MKADLCALRHVRCHPASQRGLARRRTAQEPTKIAVVAAHCGVSSQSTVGDNFRSIVVRPSIMRHLARRHLLRQQPPEP